MPALDRQAVRHRRPLPPSLQGLPPRSVPEVAPTPLQKHYINLSVIVLICGAIAITALNLGARLGDPLIKLCVIVARRCCVVTTADAIVRIWRSALGLDGRRSWQGSVPPRLGRRSASSGWQPSWSRRSPCCSPRAGRASTRSRLRSRAATAAPPISPSGGGVPQWMAAQPELLLELRRARCSSARSRARTATGCPARTAATSPTSIRASSSRPSRSPTTARSCCCAGASSPARPVGPARRLPRGRRDRQPGGHPRDAGGDRPAGRARRDHRAVHAARGGRRDDRVRGADRGRDRRARPPRRSRSGRSRPRTSRGPGLAFRTTMWALRDWLDRHRPDVTWPRRRDRLQRATATAGARAGSPGNRCPG